MSEISPDNVRSRLVSFFMLGGLCGSLIAYLTDYAFSPFHEWRWMFGLGAIPAVMLGIGMLFLPESPRWHVLVDKARTVLRRIRGTADVEGELEDIQRSLGRQKGGWAELMSPVVRPA